MADELIAPPMDVPRDPKPNTSSAEADAHCAQHIAAAMAAAAAKLHAALVRLPVCCMLSVS